MFRKILSIITLILVAFVIYKAWPELTETIGCVTGGACPDGGEFSINLFIVLLLIPEQLFMYFTAGQIFFSYMKAKKTTKEIKPWQLARISFELNFVNHAVPSGGVSGLGYIAWRLHEFGATAGQVSFMYLLRYIITIVANQTQTIFAIVVLLLCNAIPNDAMWMVGLVGLMSVGIIAGIALGIAVASKRKLINWFSKIAAKVCNNFVEGITFGKKKNVLPYKKVNKFFLDLHEDLLSAKRDKKILVKPVLWGIVYNFLEIATYEIVAIALGHPEIFPQIMVAEALASVIGAIVPLPGGVGGYEGSMIYIITKLGTPLPIASTVVIVTRVIVLMNTIVSGYGFYQNAISKIGKNDRKKIMEMNGE